MDQTMPLQPWNAPVRIVGVVEIYRVAHVALGEAAGAQVVLVQRRRAHLAQFYAGLHGRRSAGPGAGGDALAEVPPLEALGAAVLLAP
jgi:hypothetical protein